MILYKRWTRFRFLNVELYFTLGLGTYQFSERDMQELCYMGCVVLSVNSVSLIKLTFDYGWLLFVVVRITLQLIMPECRPIRSMVHRTGMYNNAQNIATENARPSTGNVNGTGLSYVNYHRSRNRTRSCVTNLQNSSMHNTGSAMIRIVVLNANGIKNKFFEVAECLQNFQIDVLIITETHCVLNTDVPVFHGYDVNFINRPISEGLAKANKHKRIIGGGGIAIYSRTALRACIIPFEDGGHDCHYDNLWIQFPFGVEHLAVSAIYALQEGHSDR